MIRTTSRTSSIKIAQKESVILRLVSTLFAEAGQDIPKLTEFSITHVKLSTGKSMCRIYLYSPEGKAHFDAALPELKLYKPSLRKALAEAMNARYTPDLVFVFDAQLDKTMRIELLLDSVKDDVHTT